MKYCKSHNNKAYTEQGFDKIGEVCRYSRAFQDVNSGKIRVYCFASIDKAILDKAICPLVKTGGKK